ncbi:MAG: hypothetical protein JWO38_6749 [Gemmataceae bacterium]|nr:hypothetical protein [Gemmataceae bacterium]
MTTLLTTLRQHAPRVTARQFLAAHPGSFIQYYDDTPAKDPAKALSARTFDPGQARRKQRERCAVGFSLQPFGERRIKDDLLCFRTMGVDVDLIAPPARATMTAALIDERKEAYLRSVLAPFPLKPHWLTETRHGFHLLFRVQPLREPKDIAGAQAINRRLVSVLRGDPNAVLLTQLLRVPGTLQFKVPDQPFLCRLLLDNAGTIAPYPLATIRDVLRGREEQSPRTSDAARGSTDRGVPRWQDGLGGVAEGHRNATAASLIGKILRRLPEELWETAGWGGLREWNGRNTVPLPERELRSVFLSIARRERTARRVGPRPLNPSTPCPTRLW